MNTRHYSYLNHLNRVLIASLTLGGLLMDGMQLADLLCTAALLVWLWLPQCTRLEARLLRRITARRGRLSVKTSPFLKSNFGIRHYRSQP